MVEKTISFIRDLYETNDFIGLHTPTFSGNESRYLQETIDSTFVSSVGEFVDEFEKRLSTITSSTRAIATVNGTSALHTALYMCGVKESDVVITQSLTFIATCNAIAQLGAQPAFVDVSIDSLGMCPDSLSEFLTAHASIDGSGKCRLKQTNQVIKAVVPMHTFGHPVQLDELVTVCQNWNIALIEDAAESLGSYYKGIHTGTFGRFGAVSFNGNKIVTTGGGGALLCKDEQDGIDAKHITTTAKVPHPYEFHHDQLGFNYRMPNLNAALGVAQLESLSRYLESKRQIAQRYLEFFANTDYKFVEEPEYATSNYWLNAVICPDKKSRDELLQTSNSQKVMMRPVWQLMHTLPMFKTSLRADLENSEFLESRLVNIPSSPF